MRKIVHALHGEAPHESLKATERFRTPFEERIDRLIDRRASTLLDHAFGELSPDEEHIVFHGLHGPSLPARTGGQLVEAKLQPIDVQPLAQEEERSGDVVNGPTAR